MLPGGRYTKVMYLCSFWLLSWIGVGDRGVFRVPWRRRMVDEKKLGWVVTMGLLGEVGSGK